MASIIFLAAFTFVSAAIILKNSFNRSSQGVKIKIPVDGERKN